MSRRAARDDLAGARGVLHRRPGQRVDGAVAVAADRHAVAVAERHDAVAHLRDDAAADRLQPRGRRADAHLQLDDDERLGGRGRNAERLRRARSAPSRWRSTRGIPTRPATRSASARSRSRSAGRWACRRGSSTSCGLARSSTTSVRSASATTCCGNPTALTAEEFELIKEHPALGARILRTVPFLTAAPADRRAAPRAARRPRLSLRPDVDEIPLLARIVHVADAFDAMTSARAYRPALDSGYAIRELWRCAGHAVRCRGRAGARAGPRRLPDLARCRRCPLLDQVTVRPRRGRLALAGSRG